jgi:DNA polymerase-3 subunit alpha
MEKFSRYGFNQSHSTAYAFISYWTAYLKTHVPTCFMAGLLTSVQGDTDKVAEYVGECRELGIAVLPPDINESQSAFTPARDGVIRFGLGAIKYVGENAIAAILAARASGPFASFFDMCRRIEVEGLDREALEALVRVGAFDRFGASRRGLLRRLPEGLELSQIKRRERQTGQQSMFGDGGGAAADPSIVEEEFEQADLLAFEKELLGLYITAHPLDQHAELVSTYCTPLREVAKLSEGEWTLVGGRVKSVRRIDTRRGGQMAFVVLEDGTSQVEAAAFPRLLESAGDLLREDALIGARIQVTRRNGESSLVLEEVFPLTDVAAHCALCLNVVLDSELVSATILDPVVALLEAHPGPAPVSICVADRIGETEIVVSAGERFSVAPTARLCDALRGLAGVVSVELASEVVR